MNSQMNATTSIMHNYPEKSIRSHDRHHVVHHILYTPCQFDVCFLTMLLLTIVSSALLIISQYKSLLARRIPRPCRILLTMDAFCITFASQIS